METEVARPPAKMRSGLTREQVQKVIDQVEELIDLNNDYENKPPCGGRPAMHCGNSLRAAQTRMKECLEECVDYAKAHPK